MPKLDGSVGQGAQNQRHDVAVVQAALGKARGRDRKPYWPGPIDGDYPRHRRALDQSIAVFQQCHRLRPSGKINRLGSDVDRLETALPAGHGRMSGVPGTVLVRRRNTAAPAPFAEAAARTEATTPLPDFERAALAALQRDLFEAHKLYFKVTGLGVVSGGRFQVSLTCPDSEWLDLRRNVFELGGRLPRALRKGLEGTLRGAARAWKIAPASGDRPGLVLASTHAFPALQPGAAPKGTDLDALAITQVPGDPTARACLAACVELAVRGETETLAGRKQFDDLAEAVGVMHPQTLKTLVTAAQTAKGGGATALARPTTWPVQNPKVTSPFGPRPSPTPGASTQHNGVDFRAPSGTTIYSTEDGIIHGIGSNSRAGNHIFVRNNNGSMSSYSHTAPLASLAVGQSVRAGDPIGSSDGSGNISGPHLHYVYRPGTPQSPATPATTPIDPVQSQFGGAVNPP
ncbi:MAG: M23 family metallopeptidase [Alphaproteobacteria bacterium]|nr:M23 family metallopeptidase [Alphaproteobacteria bacterium]